MTSSRVGTDFDPMMTYDRVERCTIWRDAATVLAETRCDCALAIALFGLILAKSWVAGHSSRTGGSLLSMGEKTGQKAAIARTVCVQPRR
jgi:hypothetical protein